MSDYLVHYGIKGQSWGRRRFQNKDGSLTPAGEKRYDGSYTPYPNGGGKSGTFDNSSYLHNRAAANVANDQKRGYARTTWQVRSQARAVQNTQQAQAAGRARTQAEKMRPIQAAQERGKARTEYSRATAIAVQNMQKDAADGRRRTEQLTPQPTAMTRSMPGSGSSTRPIGRDRGSSVNSDKNGTGGVYRRGEGLGNNQAPERKRDYAYVGQDRKTYANVTQLKDNGNDPNSSKYQARWNQMHSENERRSEEERQSVSANQRLDKMNVEKDQADGRKRTAYVDFDRRATAKGGLTIREINGLLAQQYRQQNHVKALAVTYKNRIVRSVDKAVQNGKALVDSLLSKLGRK